MDNTIRELKVTSYIWFVFLYFDGGLQKEKKLFYLLIGPTTNLLEQVLHVILMNFYCSLINISAYYQKIENMSLRCIRTRLGLFSSKFSEFCVW